MSQECIVYNLGMADYQPMWELQGRLAADIASGSHPPALLLVEHPHTYTFGRRGKAEHLLWDSAELERRGVCVHWVDRGGDVTYHGPGQRVGYPLLPLAPGGLWANQENTGTGEASSSSGNADAAAGRMRLPQADFIGYLRRLEESLILALFRLGLAAAQIEGLTGVWVEPDVLSRCRNCAPDLRRRPAKIASIGVKVDVRGVTRHGFALNVDPDMSYWDGIIGCGLVDAQATSLAELLNPAPTMERATHAVVAAFGEVFGYRMVDQRLDSWRME